MTDTLEIITGDITRLAVDAVVNAANGSLLGGGGVDGAIHRAGGPTILEACRNIRKQNWPDGLPPGKAVLTTGGQLAAPYVVHTVGPIFARDPAPDEKLAACYRNSLQLAARHHLGSIAFPGISTGVYGFPKPRAASIAIDTIRSFQGENPGVMPKVILCAFSPGDAEILTTALDKWGMVQKSPI